jgi:hypothetical protein
MLLRIPFAQRALLAPFGPVAMCDLSPACEPNQTSANYSEFTGSRPRKRAPGQATGSLGKIATTSSLLPSTKSLSKKFVARADVDSAKDIKYLTVMDFSNPEQAQSTQFA